MRRYASFFTVSCFLIAFLHAATPSRVIVQIRPLPVFSHANLENYTSEVIISVFDSSGNPVPENTPIAISTFLASGYLPDTLYSARQFKVDYDPSYRNDYYFWTDAQGKVTAQYAGRKTVPPGDSATVYLQAFAVRFSDPTDPTTAGRSGSDLIDTANSTVPFFLVSVSRYDITVYGRYGDHYVFEAYDAARIDSTRIQAKFYDAAHRVVPPGVLVGLSIYRPNIWGTLEGPEIVHRDTIPSSVGFPEERHYFFHTDDNGEIEFTYVPPNTGNAIVGLDNSYRPWHIWYELNKDRFPSKEAAFADWENARTISMSVHTAHLAKDDWQLSWELELSSGHLPVLVGPSLVRFRTVGSLFGTRYLFTNESLSERARITVELFSDLERPVPNGTPLALENAISTRDVSVGCDPFVYGRIQQSTPYPVEYHTNECGDQNYWAVVRTGANGTVQLTVDPPYAALRAEKPHWGDYNDPYLQPAFQQPEYLKIELVQTSDSEAPILTSAYDVSAQFEPSYLGPGKIFSRARVKAYDTQGRPVPRGATLLFSVNEGFIFGVETNNVYLKSYVMQPGRVTVPYISPTRSLNTQKTVTLYVSKTVKDPWGGGYKEPLASTSILLEGIAYSPLDASISKLIFGKTLEDILADLNPLKALGSMRDLADRAVEARQARIRLLELAGSSSASEEELQQAYQDFRQKFANVAHAIAGFIQDVPGTSFDPNFPITAQGTVTDVLEKGVRRYYQDQLMNKFKSELENQVNDFITQQLLDPILNVNNSLSLGTSSFTLLGDNLQTELLTPLHFMDGETRMFKIYAFRFRVRGFHERPADSLFQVTQQYPLSAYWFPEAMLADIAPGQPIITPGIMEVENIVDAQTVDFVALGVICANAIIVPDYIADAIVTDTSDTALTWLDGNGVQLPAAALDFTPGVQDSAQLFLLPLPPPNPVNQMDSTVIHSAYALGHISLPDSSIQPLAFNHPAAFIVQLATIDPDSSMLPDTFRPYRYDETTGRWEALPPLPGYDSTVVAFSISGTGIYGVGGPTASVPVTRIPDPQTMPSPRTFVLQQNYPNPFNGSTVIRYYLPRQSRVTMTIYDVQGRRIASLVNHKQKAGWHDVRWNARNQQGLPVSSGLYFYELVAGDRRLVRKMLLVQ